MFNREKSEDNKESHISRKSFLTGISALIFTSLIMTGCGGTKADCPTDPFVCENNLVQNGNFVTGTVGTGEGGTNIGSPGSTLANWTIAFGSPQYTNSPSDPLAGLGHANPGSIVMWGNKVVGEGIKQTLTTPIKKGCKYRLHMSVRYLNDGSSPTIRYVRCLARASNAALTSPSVGGTKISEFGFDPTTPYAGNTPLTPLPVGIANQGITDQSWKNYVSDIWVADADYNMITINPTNESSVDDGELVTWVGVDNVCLVKVK
jgi:hypothetical protein